MRRRTSFNPKRKLRLKLNDARELGQRLAPLVKYGGNPEHKRNPGDFGLTPPAAPRPGKTLCDGARITTREQALALIRAGLERGLLSEREENGWPQNIWAVAEGAKGETKVPLEAMLENPVTGTYHGYPLQDGDPIISDVVERWFGAVS